MTGRTVALVWEEQARQEHRDGGAVAAAPLHGGGGGGGANEGGWRGRCGGRGCRLTGHGGGGSAFGRGGRAGGGDGVVAADRAAWACNIFIKSKKVHHFLARKTRIDGAPISNRT
jgi:hypothetical protein